MTDDSPEEKATQILDIWFSSNKGDPEYLHWLITEAIRQELVGVANDLKEIAHTIRVTRHESAGRQTIELADYDSAIISFLKAVESAILSRVRIKPPPEEDVP